MIHLLRRTLRLVVLGGVGYGVWKSLWGRNAADTWADSWVSTGEAGATPPAAAPVPPVADDRPRTNGEVVHTPLEPPVGSEAGGNGRAAGAAAGGEAPGPSRPVTARPGKPSRTGPARKTPTGKVEEPPGERLWVPANDGVCPKSHPVKAKLSSKIFHMPGARNYARTHADRCYPDEETALADGLRPALR